MKNEECIEGNDGRYKIDYTHTSWTNLARECYERRCECIGCDLIPRDFVDRCKVKETVAALTSNQPREVDKKYNKEEIEAIYYQKGKTIADIGLHYHISVPTIKGIMVALGIKLKGRGRMKEC